MIFVLEFKRITKHSLCGGQEEDFSVFALFAFNLKLIQLLYIMVCAMSIASVLILCLLRAVTRPVEQCGDFSPVKDISIKDKNVLLKMFELL